MTLTFTIPVNKLQFACLRKSYIRIFYKKIHDPDRRSNQVRTKAFKKYFYVPRSKIGFRDPIHLSKPIIFSPLLNPSWDKKVISESISAKATREAKKRNFHENAFLIDSNEKPSPTYKPVDDEEKGRDANFDNKRTSAHRLFHLLRHILRE